MSDTAQAPNIEEPAPPQGAPEPVIEQPEPTRDDLIEEVMDYRRQGHDIGLIAASMQRPRAEIEDYYAEGLKKLLLTPEHEAQLLDLDRVTRMIAAVYGDAASGNREDIGLVMQLTERRNALEANLLPFVSKVFGGLEREQKRGKAGVPGRPEHIPTEETRFAVTCMTATGATQIQIAKIIGVSIKTLVKHYSDELENTLVRINAEVGYSVLNQARRGHLGAAQFWLTRRGGWKETNVHELTGADGKPLPSSVKFDLNFISAPPGSLSGGQKLLDAEAVEVEESQ
jgi:DNA-binding CsgD family transcriptional regulator